MQETGTSSAGNRSRWRPLDSARGIAVIAMILYHACWNLIYFGILPQDILHSLGWKLSGGTIAAAFLAISGASLTLAHSGGFRSNLFWKRLLKIAAAAALVSIATWFLFPDSFIFFGILHCLAVTSLLALPFLKAPAWLCAVASFCALFAPYLFRQSFWDIPWLDWIGFGISTPVTNDYVPVFPWLGFVLAGLLLGRIFIGRYSIGSGNILSRMLVWAGRWSLAIYLIHQPLLFGATQLIATSGLLAPYQITSQQVLQKCQERCDSAEGDPALCRATCSCIIGDLSAKPEHASLWENLRNNKVSRQDSHRIQMIAESCSERLVLQNMK